MPSRVLSGMRPTGALHIGHLCGALANWRELQKDRDCFFFVADWHALTTEYAQPPNLAAEARETAAAWLSAGINPDSAAVFVQSHVPEHAELFTLLAPLCPLPWLERVPTYREQIEQLRDSRDLATYGFLGYPLLQAADILIYRANEVPVGEDQAPHIEFAREIARRFNNFYGRDAQAENDALEKTPPALRKTLAAARAAHSEKGDDSKMKSALQEIASAPELSKTDREILEGYVQSAGRRILSEPSPLLTEDARLPGTDGRKMSKSYGNAVGFFESEKDVEVKLVRMTTDPARQRRSDPGSPEKCPAFQIHKAFSDSETLAWADAGCRSAEIGCVDCKKALAKNVNAVLNPIRERRAEWTDKRVDDALSAGADKARKTARETMREARQAMRLTN